MKVQRRSQHPPMLLSHLVFPRSSLRFCCLPIPYFSVQNPPVPFQTSFRTWKASDDFQFIFVKIYSVTGGRGREGRAVLVACLSSFIDPLCKPQWWRIGACHGLWRIPWHAHTTCTRHDYVRCLPSSIHLLRSSLSAFAVPAGSLIARLCDICRCFLEGVHIYHAWSIDSGENGLETSLICLHYRHYF